MEKKKIKPLIKWTGGKYEEYPLFSRYIPAFENYYEPFFGGGGVFFALQPQKQSFLNDKSVDLALFYSQIHSKRLQAELEKYALAWEQAGRLSHRIIGKLKTPFNDFLRDNIALPTLQKNINDVIDRFAQDDFHPLFDEDFTSGRNAFIHKMKASLADKCKRIKAICHKEGRVFDLHELEDHIETGVKSGLYLHLRSITNQYFKNTRSLSKEKATANWYFVREFCYASMFRYNRKGEFNIPYGGIAYNKKNFRLKVQLIFKPAIQQLFANATFCNLDFEKFLQQTSPKANDFIFLDPPYDSEFSEYDQNAFTKNDQVRLRDVLAKTPAKWMLVIKETPFIRELYNQPGMHCITFDKTYTYNVRGRNNRDTKHLIVVNYDT